MTKLEYRFWSKVDIKGPDECWDFIGATNPDGYGKFWLNGKEIKAHRLIWEVYNGREVPIGKLILHKCDNPSCVNPKHLYCGDHADNMKDMYSKRRGAKVIHGKAILSAAEIQAIRKMKGIYPRKSVAEKLGIGIKTVWSIWSSGKHPCKEGYYV